LSPATAPPSTAASPSATPNAQFPGGSSSPNRPPNVGGIIATFVQPVTSYTVQASDPDGDPLRYSWTSTNPFGTYTGATTQTFAWSHPHPPCPDETSHPGTITVQINDEHYILTRNYQRKSLAN